MSTVVERRNTDLMIDLYPWLLNNWLPKIKKKCSLLTPLLSHKYNFRLQYIVIVTFSAWLTLAVTFS